MDGSPPRPIRTKPCLSNLVLAALGLGLAACSTHSAPAPAGRPSTASPPADSATLTPPMTTPTPPPPPVRSSTASPAGAAGPTHCTSGQLRFTAVAGSDGAAGTIYRPIRVANIGPATCWTRGYVRLGWVDASGRTLPSPTIAPVLSEDNRRVTLTKTGWGWFMIGQPSDPSFCEDAPRTATQLAITAPGATSAQVITWGPGCDHLRLSPIRPASAWLPLE